MNNSFSGKLKRFYLSWYPGWLAEDSRARNRANRIILAGIAIRFLLMPFAVHNDFLSEHIRVYQIVEGVNLFPGILQIVPHYIDTLYMKLVQFMVPDIGSIFSPDIGGLTTVGIERFMEFCQESYIFRIIFLFKIPYLITEIIVVFLIIKLLERNKNTLSVLKFLMFNPALIYAVYIFGRFEIYVFLFLILSIYFVKKENIFLAGIFFGLSIITRAFPAFFLPIFAIFLPVRARGKVIFSVFSFIPLALAMALFKLYNIIKAASGIQINAVARIFSKESSFISTIFSFSNTAGRLQSSGFILFYSLLLIFIFYMDRKARYGIKTEKGCQLSRSTEQSFNYFLINISYFTIVFFMLFYLTINYSAHWMSWFLPFGALLIFKKKKYFYLFFILLASWFFYWIFNTDIGVFTPYLLAPIDGGYFHQLAQRIGQRLLNFAVGDYFNLGALIVIFRGISSAVIIWILVEIGRDIREYYTDIIKNNTGINQRK